MKVMGAVLFIKFARVLILTFPLILISKACIAPVVDFHERVDRFRYLYEVAEKLYHEYEYSRFINDLGYSESKNDWLCVNRIGCFGEWQFAESTLRHIGYKHITLKKFKADPAIFPREMQRKALDSLIKVNLSSLRNYKHFLGDTVKGVVITKSGMIAASHLGGAGSLKSYLRTNGRINRKDVLGTSIHHYLKKFHDYDLE